MKPINIFFYFFKLVVICSEMDDPVRQRHLLADFQLDLLLIRESLPSFFVKEVEAFIFSTSVEKKKTLKPIISGKVHLF